MPELPSVEIFKRYFDENSLNQHIQDINVYSPEILVENTPKQLEKAMKGHKFISSLRHGKYLFIKLDSNMYLFMHFGMTGFLNYFEKKGSRHIRILITFNNGHKLAFDDARKFGKVGLTHNPDDFISEKRLGDDALQISFDSFNKLFKGRSGMIKPLLMNQNFIAGIGNLYADEILYQCRIHPVTHVNQLKPKNIKILYQNMRKVLHQAIKYKDTPYDFPDSFLLSHRHPQAKCPDGTDLEIIKVGGRTTYLCPSRQVFSG